MKTILTKYLGRSALLAVIVASLIVTSMALSGCSSEQEAVLEPSGTQFAEQGSASVASDDDANADVKDSKSDNTASSKAPEKSAYTKLEKRLSAKVNSYGDKVAITVAPVDDEDTRAIDINGDEQFVSASMIKLLILAEFIDEVDEGAISLDDVYVSKRADIVGGTGAIQNEPVGTRYAYDDLACAMIMYSDNTATNVLIDAMGMDAINEKAVELGLKHTKLNRKMMDLASGIENYISANDAAKILCGIAKNELGSKKLCRKAMGYLQKQTDNAGLAQGFPSGVVFAHKTGSLNSIRHDGGIVECGSPYVLVVLTDIGAQHANDLMESIASTISRLLGN